MRKRLQQSEFPNAQYDTEQLLRYLSAKKGDVDAATQMLLTSCVSL
jgi:hypothetical protein